MQTPSPVAGDAPAAPKLPKLNDRTWLLHCTDTLQRDELLAHAANRGVPCYRHNHNNPLALTLGWLYDLMAYYGPKRDEEKRVTPDQFKAMCDAYAAR